MIVQHDTPNGPAFSTEHRGTAYYASKIADRWCVVSTRNATRAAGFGQTRWFDTVADLDKGLTAFRGLSALGEA